MILDRIGHELFGELDAAIGRVRDHFNSHPSWRTIMQHLDDLIAAGRALKSERATLLADRDAQKARADKAEADLAALQSHVSDDEAQAGAAATKLQTEVAAETATAIDPNTGLPVAG